MKIFLNHFSAFYQTSQLALWVKNTPCIQKYMSFMFLLQLFNSLWENGDTQTITVE